jgi:hypothetical protein
MTSRFAWILCLSLAPCVPGLARADSPSAQSAAAAEALYREGKRLLVDGRADLACPKLETSQSLDAAVGTLLLLGHCYEQLGKTASAWATFRGAESMADAAGQGDRSQIARVRADALESQLSRLELSLPSEVDTRAWSVREEGRELSAGVLGVPIPVDPGPRRISASAPGYESWSAQVDVPPGNGLTTLRIPRLNPQRTLEPPRAAASRSEPSEPHPRAAVAGAESGNLRTWSSVGFGLGVASLAVGGTYAVLASNRYDASLGACRTEALCSPRGLALRESAENHARVATVAVLSGALLSSAGLVGWLLAPDDPREAPPGRTSLELGALASEHGFGIETRGTF